MKIIVHSCAQQIKIAEGSKEPPAGKCRCRKEIETSEGALKVKNGDASWVITKIERITQEFPCSFCHGDLEFKGCPACWGRGREIKTVEVPTYGNDIVLVSRKPHDKKETKRGSALAMKTPRTPTIEQSHILRAYVSDATRNLVSQAEQGDPEAGEWGTTEELGVPSQAPRMMYTRERTSPERAKAARFRIEEYGRMTREVTNSLIVGFEPDDDPKKGQGRKYDFGRSI